MCVRCVCVCADECNVCLPLATCTVCLRGWLYICTCYNNFELFSTPRRRFEGIPSCDHHACMLRTNLCIRVACIVLTVRIPTRTSRASLEGRFCASKFCLCHGRTTPPFSYMDVSTSMIYHHHHRVHFAVHVYNTIASVQFTATKSTPKILAIHTVPTTWTLYIVFVSCGLIIIMVLFTFYA